MTQATRRHFAYLQAMLDSMAQAVSVFDENLRLRWWNPELLQVLELPPEAVYDGVSFEELIRIPAGRGEYGPGDPEVHVARITTLARQFNAHTVERTRPNGRTHLVQGRPLMVDGKLAGFITTYTDITARKVAEETNRHQQALIESIINHLPCGISVFDAQQVLVYHNDELLRLLDLPLRLLENGPLTLEAIFRFNAERGEYGPGDVDTLVGDMLARAARPVRHRIERTRPNGVTLDIQGNPLPGGGFVTLYTDVSEKRRVAERERLAQTVFNRTPTGIVVTDEEYRIISINPATTQMTGYDAFELTGHTIFALVNPAPGETVAEIDQALSGQDIWAGERSVTRKDGVDFPAGLRVSRVTDQQSGATTHYIWILLDITERRQAEERMRHIAQTDALTGLPNRMALMLRLAQMLPEARRYERQLAIMFIDLDRFKIINDTLGHQVGDDLLREVACRLSAVVRESDFIARLGGDEFVVVLPHLATPADAAIVAGKIIASLGRPIMAEGHELHTSPSIGISLFPNDGPDGDTILKNADTAMYHAKSAGRNTYQFFAADMNQSTALRLDIERKLRHAIDRNELALCFQPQFLAGENRPCGVEALLRWHHPTDGMIPPDQFIPVAEETGIIVDIGEWVLLEACKTLQHWLECGLPPMRMAVNVSARQLRRRDFCETVAGILACTGVSPECLELEITESAVMEDPEEATDILQRLGRMGVSLAVDDFGTGYSSLAYLKRFPIDYLKIDRSFVRDIETDLNDRAIAFGTIALAHSLGLKVIAEGVETEDQLELLRANGCDEVQGYLFSKPLTPAAAFAFLHARSGAANG